MPRSVSLSLRAHRHRPIAVPAAVLLTACACVHVCVLCIQCMPYFALCAPLSRSASLCYAFDCMCARGSCPPSLYDTTTDSKKLKQQLRPPAESYVACLCPYVHMVSFAPQQKKKEVSLSRARPLAPSLLPRGPCIDWKHTKHRSFHGVSLAVCVSHFLSGLST